jgi:dimethylsulfoniopropionate demethylase
MSRVFGEEILKMKFFHFKRYPFAGHDFLIARSGWSKQGGFEIYVDDDVKGLELYDALSLKGKDLDVRPGCPNLIERIEGGLLSYGNDMDMNDTPLECGLDAFVSFNPDIEYLGKSILEKQYNEGVNRSLVGLKLQMDKISITKFIPIFQGSKKIGEIRSACFSPEFQCCLGIAMVNKSEQDTSQPLQVSIEGLQITAQMTPLPFTK